MRLQVSKEKVQKRLLELQELVAQHHDEEFAKWIIKIRLRIRIIVKATEEAENEIPVEDLQELKLLYQQEPQLDLAKLTWLKTMVEMVNMAPGCSVTLGFSDFRRVFMNEWT